MYDVIISFQSFLFSQWEPFFQNSIFMMVGEYFMKCIWEVASDGFLRVAAFLGSS